MPIVFIDFGKLGRLGNALFQYASLIGFSTKYDCKLELPSWHYAEFFEGEFPQSASEPKIDIRILEPDFHYIPSFWDSFSTQFRDKYVNIRGWLQSEKYWIHSKPEVLKRLTFRKPLADALREKYKSAFTKPVIAISVRRGDYVNNPEYEQLPITFYLLSLYEHFDVDDYHLMIFSDDFEYCKTHFEGFSNVFYAEVGAIEQLCLMSMCDHFIIANSTFSWWGAYLGEKPHSKIVRPGYLFDGELKKISDSRDFYPERWTVFDHKEKGVCKQIDLQDVTFAIAVQNNRDTHQYLTASIQLIRQYFHTSIVIGEYGSNKLASFNEYGLYVHFDNIEEFDPQSAFEQLASFASTSIVFNWDIHTYINPAQICEIVRMIKQGNQVVSDDIKVFR